MNKIRYQTFLLTRVLQGHTYPSTQALLDAIVAANAIPETEWSTRRAAFGALEERAPLRSGSSTDFAITYREIPEFLEREWKEFHTFSKMTRRAKPSELEAMVRKFWLTDEEMGHGPRPGVDAEDDGEDEDETDGESGQRM
jgi:hypothetical protein